MHKIRTVINTNNTPWDIPTHIRYRAVKEASITGKRVALLLYERADTSTFRYRAYNIMQATEQSAKWRSIYFFINEMKDIIELIKYINILIVIRTRWDHNLDQIVHIAKSQNVPVLFDIDDLVFDLDHLKVTTNTLNVSFNSEQDYDFWFAYIGRIGYAASLADGFITTNKFIGDILHNKYNKKYNIIINTFNKEQKEASDVFREEKRKSKTRSPFVIGYFSGTPSHINDFREVHMEMMELLNDNDDMRLRVVGFMDFPNNMKKYIDNGKIEFSPLVDFIELQRLIAEVDVNIVPLVDNVFTNCKSELKYFESALVDTITVATPTYAYEKCIENGINGYLCRPGNWYSTINQIYKNDQTNLIDYAYKDATDKYYNMKQIENIENCYDKYI